LNSDDDDVGSDGNIDDSDPQTNNLIIGLYQKVTRVKNKRKVQLRNLVFHIRGKDYVVRSAVGEFDW
jgi:hypothetical protein